MDFYFQSQYYTLFLGIIILIFLRCWQHTSRTLDDCSAEKGVMGGETLLKEWEIILWKFVPPSPIQKKKGGDEGASSLLSLRQGKTLHTSFSFRRRQPGQRRKVGSLILLFDFFFYWLKQTNKQTNKSMLMRANMECFDFHLAAPQNRINVLELIDSVI